MENTAVQFHSNIELNTAVKNSETPEKRRKRNSGVGEIVDLTLSDEELEKSSNTLTIDLTLVEDKLPCSSTCSVYKKFMKYPSRVARFIARYAESICGKVFLPAVSIKAVSNGIQLLGSKNNVNKAKLLLEAITWHEDQLTYTFPCLWSYFLLDSWKDFVKVVESEVRCTIEVEKREVEQEKKDSCDSSSVMSQSPASQMVSDDAVVQAKYESLSVVVCKGNIVEDSSEVIVNGVNSQFDLHIGAVSNEVAKKAGKEIVQACSTCDASNPLLRMTRGFNLPCKFVFHLVTPRVISEYVNHVKEALNWAEKFSLSSIAFPALGTGHIGLDPVKVSLQFAEAVSAFALKEPQYVETIKLVVFDPALFSIFSCNLVTCKVLSSFGKRRHDDLELQANRANASRISVLYVSGDNKAAVNEGIERIKKHMSKCIRKKALPGDVVMKLSDHDCIDIYKASIGLFTAVTFEQKQIMLVGLADNVDKLYDFVRDIGYEQCAAETLARIASWSWELSYNNYELLPLRASAELERLYERQREKDQTPVPVEVRLYGAKLFVDFAKMSFSFNSITGKVKRLTTVTKTSELPDHWSDMEEKSSLRVSLDESSLEYAEVANQFRQSKPKYRKIMKIERIQNPALYKQYNIKKSDVEKHMIVKGSVERNLFHGTSDEDAEKICCEGFDRGFAGKNATMFGKGCYFAVNSSYSIKYAKRKKNRRQMFLAKVLTGDYCQGESSYQAAPEKNDLRPFDSVVDNTNNPTIFVVFKDSSSYPSHLIHFN